MERELGGARQGAVRRVKVGEVRFVRLLSGSIYFNCQVFELPDN